MPFGYNGKIARINLKTMNVAIESSEELIYRMYLGGRGLVAYVLYREMKAGVDPLGPDNKLIFATSVITGVPIPGMCKYSVGAKSPLTNGFGEAEAGGFFGPELKFAGFDALVIEDAADSPVYIWIHDGIVELRNADRIWGKPTKETQDAVRGELNDKLIRIASIGPAGERLIRFACIINELRFANGRSGLGAVMGSKNLKAVAVRGHKRLETRDPDTLKELAKWFTQNLKASPGAVSRRTYGTGECMIPMNFDGTLPTRNFQEGSFEFAEDISGEKMKDTILIGTDGCYACSMRCKRIVRTKGPYEVDALYGGPEYETLAAFGSLCGTRDLNAICMANQLCNAYSMDTISTACTVAFAIECFENGMITLQDTDGLRLEFGNPEMVLRLTEMIARRKGIGNVLAEGVKRASDQIGKGSAKFALHVKGKEIPMEDPRGLAGVGLQYALSPSGADHMQAPDDSVFEQKLDDIKPLDIIKTVGRLDIGPQKVRLFVYGNLWWGLLDCLGVCKFTITPHSASVFKIHHLVEIVNAATGWDTSLWNLMKSSERAVNLARCFNIREGFTDRDDTLPERLFEELRSGPRKGSKISEVQFRSAVRLYYEMMGWDPRTGIPSEAKLKELDLA